MQEWFLKQIFEVIHNFIVYGLINLIEQLMTFSRETSLSLFELDPLPVFKETLKMLRALVPSNRAPVVSCK